MPLINKIEVSNFMNSRREDPWRPDWTFQTFDLKSENTAINMPNGRGKSTLVLAVLALLAHDKSIHELRKTHFSPQSTGHYTHIRIETYIWVEDDSPVDLVVQSGGDAGGTPMIFGLYGNSGESGSFKVYAYRGTLQDCPIGKREGNRITLTGNQDFLDKLSAMPGRFPTTQREDTRVNWREHVSGVFDMPSIEQQLVYQKAKGAEGSSGYFDVNPPRGKQFSEAVFYERLAPELLVDMMGSVEEYADERGIEDVIHQKVQGIIKAKARTAKTADDLEKTRRVLDELERVKTRADAVVEAKADTERKVAEFSLQHAALKAVVVDAPVPGLLRQPPEEAPILIRSMVMQHGNWYLPDKAFEIFAGENSGNVNAKKGFDRSQIESAENSQLIDFNINSFSAEAPKTSQRGPAASLYNLEMSLSWLAVTTNFKNSFTRESASRLVRDAFEWVEAHGDTNPARVEHRQLTERISTLNGQRTTFSERRDTLHQESVNLRNEQQQIGLQQAEYRRMADSDLFSEEELRSPFQTGQKAEKEFSTADLTLSAHRQNVALNKNSFEEWQAFVAKHGEDADPLEYAEALEEVKDNAEGALSSNKDDLEAAKESAKKAKGTAETDKKAFETLAAKAEKIGQLRPLVQAFANRFGNENPEGLLARVKKELADAERRVSVITSERASMADALSSLHAFIESHGDNVAPKSWLDTRSQERTALSTEMSGIGDVIKDLKSRRADLDKASVAPGKVAREVLDLAGTDAKPLHAFIDEIGLPQDKKERVLSMFSALLFSPVYETSERAAEVASMLAAKGVESPVFVSAELTEFCLNTNIVYDGAVARTWLVGVRTRPVDCLLDPTLVAREKDALDTQINQANETLGKKRNRFDALDPEGQEAIVARKAREAIEKGFPVKDGVLQEEASQLEAALPRLKDRASEEAGDSIRAAIEYRGLLGETSEDNLAEALATAEEKANLSRELQSRCDEAVQSLTEKREALQTAFRTASEKATEIPKLKSIRRFIDAGAPAFMKTAKTKEDEYLEAKRTAEKRKGFRFELAESFVKSGDKRPQEIETRLSVITPELNDIVEKRIPALDESIAGVEADALKLVSATSDIDNFIRELRKKYREVATAEVIPAPISSERLAEHPLSLAAQEVRLATSVNDMVKAILSMRNPLDEIEAATMKHEVITARSTLKSSRNLLSGEIDRVKGDSTIALNEQMRIGLESSKEDVGELVRMIAATTDNFNKSRAANETAGTHLEEEWSNIGSWLENFTRRLPTNFEAMRSVFKPIRDSVSGEIISAGFDIEARVADMGDVRAVLTGIVDKVEKSEKNRENLGDDEALRSRYTKNMRKEIREEFYKNVILEPTIRVCIPSISHKSLKLEKNMVSSGQGVAMSLLWIVKMADYVTERELQRQNVSNAARKRVRSMRTQFVIIDGAFSHLSDKRLITDALDSVRGKRGKFQLIITGHEPNYKNDFAYFPSYVVAREIGGNLMYAESETRRLLAPEEVGSRLGAMEVSSFHKLTEAA
ncbi:MAG: hypothetical protein WBO95_05225 [Candidatus Dechloromonas phosphoritropha]